MRTLERHRKGVSSGGFGGTGKIGEKVGGTGKIGEKVEQKRKEEG